MAVTGHPVVNVDSNNIIIQVTFNDVIRQRLRRSVKAGFQHNATHASV